MNPKPVVFRLCVVNGQEIACTNLVLVWANLIAYAEFNNEVTVLCDDPYALHYCF